MKISLYGEPNLSWQPSQLPLIRRGLLELGHELTEPADSDYLFAADPNGYKQIVEDKKKFNKPAALAILDIPTYQGNCHEIVKTFKNYCDGVDKILANSYTVQNQISTLLNLDSEVIFSPAKEICEIPLIYEPAEKLKFLVVGRVNSPNKRFNLVRELMEKYYSEEQLVVVGSENPSYGNFAGMVEDTKLNYFYNMCDFVLHLSAEEGIGLPCCESVLAGKPAIVCNDCPASMEFLPDFAADPNVDSIYQKIQEIQNNKNHFGWLIKQYQKKFKEQLNYLSVAKNIISALESI